MLQLSTFLCCLSLKIGAQFIGTLHFLLAISSVIYFTIIGYSLITRELALAMIYVILLCVIGFYMKLCVDLIIGASRNNILKILRFRTLLLISLVILALSLAWTSLNHPRKQPYKTETMISLLTSIILEIYFFMVIDVLAQTIQESTTRVTPSPS